MKASELKPGQFFYFNEDTAKMRCRKVEYGYEYIEFVQDLSDSPVTSAKKHTTSLLRLTIGITRTLKKNLQRS